MSIRVATDVGGTFTDLVYLHTTAIGEQVFAAEKVSTTPLNFEQGILNVIEEAGIPYSSIQSFVHGTTVVINALTERKREKKTGLITTENFRDVLEIARGDRPDFFNLNYKKPVPFVPRHLRRELPERISYQGEITKQLDLAQLESILIDFKHEGVEAIAICFINSYANPAHEQAVERKIKEMWPEVYVAASYQITREWREYERTSTVAMAAYVKPIAQSYLDNLDRTLRAKGFKSQPYIMQSNCGVDTIANSRQQAITMVESGPASGVLGAAKLGAILGERNIISLDIGGTTTKCSLVKEGQVKISTDYFIDKTDLSSGYPLMVPVVDIVEIGSGGGSIAHVDELKKLHVGPKSAGADPGPVAKGGKEITLTDANIVLGFIHEDSFLGAAAKVNRSALEAAFQPLADRLGVPLSDVAQRIVRIANDNMVNAIKLVSVNRGHHPSDFTLVAFGGGGGLHASMLAQELQIKKVVIPTQSAVFSAWGMLLSDLRRDFVATKLIELSDPKASEKIRDSSQEVCQHAFNEMKQDSPEKVTVEIFAKLRYRNQAHSIEIALAPVPIKASEIHKLDMNTANLADTFHTAFKREYGYELQDSPIDLVGFHVVGYVEVDKLKLKEISKRDLNPVIGTRPVTFPGFGKIDTPILDGTKLDPGKSFVGPLIIESKGTTIVALPGMPVEIDNYGNIHLSTLKTATIQQGPVSDPVTLIVVQSALRAIAQEMFIKMRRTAMSAIIYEVLDMGTAVLDKNGELASSGAGIPVFVAALDKSVKHILTKFKNPHEIEPGDLFIVNDPYNGGITHLNDVVLALPIFDGGDLVAWSALIAHWNDVGGIVPGSMSTNAQELFQEGLILPPVKLYSKGQKNEALFEILMSNSRMPDFLKGDLSAGIGAVNLAQKRVLELVSKYGKTDFLKAIHDNMLHANAMTLDALKKLPKGQFKCSEKQDDDSTFNVVVEISDKNFTVDLRNNPDQTKKPYNMSRDGAIIASQLILKSLTGGLACNGGTFRPLEVLTRKGSIFDPHPPASMGFYYETLVRVHDLIWRAMGEAFPDKFPSGSFASVCGTVLGGIHPGTKRAYTIVEPELGGWGATSSQDGIPATFSAFHGETYNCPVEISEARHGLVVDRLSFHDDEGGEGQYRGGKGVRIAYRIKSDQAFLTASYTRSKVPPWGLQGGGNGSHNYIRINGTGPRLSELTSQPLNENDVVEITTANGAGWGDPKNRNRAHIEEDLKNGYITTAQAERVYGYKRKGS
ncbi:MAG: hydantoinase B/oxoprolinase family protein [Parachlamydia sp.]|nr:hydantoinase B/oxoprolinase family protein [Parachlamydia sp.]